MTGKMKSVSFAKSAVKLWPEDCWELVAIDPEEKEREKRNNDSDRQSARDQKKVKKQDVNNDRAEQC